MSPQMKRRVLRLQPYRRSYPEFDSLWTLHSLDIADKHKLLAVIGTIVQQMGLRDEQGVDYGPNRVVHFEMARDALKDEAVAARLFLDPPEPNASARTTLTLDVVFEQGFPGGRRPTVTSTLLELLRRVSRTLEWFQKRWADA